VEMAGIREEPEIERVYKAIVGNWDQESVREGSQSKSPHLMNNSIL